ncbi:MAG: M56 family metallopeptidase [Gimesia sp.]
MNLNETTFVQLIWQQFWQCSLLVIVVYLMCRLIKYRRAHLTFLLWFLVLLKFVTPPLWTSSSGLFCWVQQPIHSELRQEPVSQGPQSLTRVESIQLMTCGDMSKLPDVEAKPAPFEVTIREIDPNENQEVLMDQGTLTPEVAIVKTEPHSSRYSIMNVGLIVWSLFAFMIVGVMAVRYWRCWRIIRSAGEHHYPELNQVLERLCKELKVKRRVRLLITNSRMGPAVMGLFRPTIILPKVITDARSLQELEPILAHELIHIRRGDLWVGLLQLMASVVWWFNPLVWFSGRCLKFEIEQCCDEEVLAELNCDPGLYAKCLLEVLELKQSLKTVPVVPGVRPVEITSKRLERIMKLGQGCQKRTPWWCWMIFVGLMVVILPGAAFVVTAADAPTKIPSNSDSEKSKLQLGEQKSTAQQSVEPTPVSDAFGLSDLNKLPYLSSEINMRSWISQSSISRTHSIKELLSRAREAVGTMQAKEFLLDQINTRMKELENLLPARDKSQYRSSIPFYFEEPKIPLKDERKQYRITGYGALIIRNDQLFVWGNDPNYHKRVAQVIAKLAEVEFTQLKVTARFISVPKSIVDKLRIRHKKMKMFTSKQVTFELYKDEKQRVTKEPETVCHHSMICEVLDAEHSHALVQKLRATNQIKVFDVPQVVLKNNQTVNVERKRGSIIEKKITSLGQLIRISDYGISLDLRPKIPACGSGEEQVMLYSKLTFSKIEGRGNLKKTDLARGTERFELIELIKEQHFKDVTMIQPGQTLVVGGFTISESAYDSKLLLVLLDVEKVKLEQNQVMHGVGVNSDAGITGQIVIDEKNFQDTLLTNTYAVADLVVPLPRKVFSPGYDTDTSQARFEPLIELIKQNITPEDWDDAQDRGDYRIVPYKKTLSLVIRHTRKGHGQIIKLLEKLRAIQDSLFNINLNLIQTSDLQKSLKVWELSEDPRVRSLLKQLKTKNLKDGIIISVQQAGIFRQIDNAQSPMTSIRLVNGQTGEAVVLDSQMRPQKSNSRIKVQVRPELLKDQKLRLSLAINPKDALDALSNLKNITLSKVRFNVFDIKGNFVLFDITDQVVGKEPAFLPYQRFNQVEQKSENPKQYFLLVAPSVSSMTEFVNHRPIPPHLRR